MDWEQFILRNKIAPTLDSNITPIANGTTLAMGTNGNVIFRQDVNGYLLSFACILAGSLDLRNTIIHWKNTAGATPAILNSPLSVINTGRLPSTYAVYTSPFDDYAKEYALSWDPPAPIYANRFTVEVDLPVPTLDPSVPEIMMFYYALYYQNIDKIAAEQTQQSIGAVKGGYTGEVPLNPYNYNP